MKQATCDKIQGMDFISCIFFLEAPMRVLLVDDERMSLEDTASVISEVDPDIEILKSDNYKDALRICGENRIDVAFLDIEMPELNGIQLAKKLKAINPTVNFIFVTAYDQYALELLAYQFSRLAMWLLPQHPMLRVRLISCTRAVNKCSLYRIVAIK